MNEQKPTFKEAMQASLLWCKSWENDEISDEVISDRIGELIKTVEGARGFFAVSFSIDCPLMDRFPDALIFQLRSSGEIVVDITVKNLAMSSAMIITHKKNNDPQEMQSERIKIRCIELLKLLNSNQVKKRLDVLLEATKGNGEDLRFLDRWGFDDEQIKAISESIYEVAT
ncbi:hypothetical protein [Prochlorococcus marinus]|uniref:Uncharacterized protein n=1 Tax=Prochlorococcus marinus XMU1408 TaxID=2213228 RepID=A0A318R770_PROMR|nr:hypothetical protein [Prochlorococcus marinus]MBW3042463.1 hypothetical protein [Prochlorococcus marinus str. XMU1408]PYE01198.1 hypothetical protein DNJ73_07165 [Prochlorococcus marinus XMU1408]